MSLIDELSKLAELRASGTLTEEEFTRAKERLLSASGPPPRTDNLASSVNTFRRSRTDRVFGGVCGGGLRQFDPPLLLPGRDHFGAHIVQRLLLRHSMVG